MTGGVVVGVKRPRDLDWYHAGPLLFGDWGTSRLYVLGLAIAFTGRASPIYLMALSALMIAVAWAYTIICRHFKEGGGVYAAARQINPLLSVIGATLLVADYIVTAALSLVDAYHYLGVPEGWPIVGSAMGTLAVLGLVNWFGSRNAGRFAMLIAIVAIALSSVIGVMATPYLIAGWQDMSWGTGIPLFTRWEHFTSIILALSGVEAVANMTGIMREPVDRTSRRTIWPVLAEVVTLNLVFSFALLGVLAAAQAGAIPFAFTEGEVKTSAMRVLATAGAEHWMGPAAGVVFGQVAAAIFAFLLISAANTVIVGMIATLYSLGQDGELPKTTTRLNYSGVPWLPLTLACGAPALLLLVVHDLESLAHLYAIGVCGAIALNVLCCAVNRRLGITRGQRIGLALIAAAMSAIWITIAITRPEAALFAGLLVLAILAARSAARAFKRADEMLPEPEIGWLAELRQRPMQLDPARPRLMLAARGRFQAEFAVDLAKQRGATLFAIYVRTLRVLSTRADNHSRLEDDPAGQEALGTVALLAHQYGVPLVPIYICSPDIVPEILDYTVTYGCDTLILGKTRRGVLARSLEGDVVSRVAQLLPDGVSLIVREARPVSMRMPDTPVPPTA